MEWKYEIFSNWCLSKPAFQEKNKSWKFRTVSHPQITEFHSLFYGNGKKVIPHQIKNLLVDPISLAVWYMDDGGVNSKRKNPTISTYCFLKQENILLIETIKENFGFQVNLNWDRTGYRLYIPVDSIKMFVYLVDSYILPSMEYKIPLTP